MKTYIVTYEKAGTYPPTLEQVTEDIKLMFSEQYGIDEGVTVQDDEIE